MSQDHSLAETAESIEIIKEVGSSNNLSVSVNRPKSPDEQECSKDCTCAKKLCDKFKTYLSPGEVQVLLKQKEMQLTADFKQQLKTEIDSLKERADFILQNEQIRASCMLREAHRERKEKILALQTQLECKNLAGLMYVMCSERRKSKLEKFRIIEEYTNFILALKEILAEAQTLILNLSRGFKTASKVDKEWRQKMTKILKEFMMFIHDYAKGTPDTEQFFFDLPNLLKTETAIIDDPTEDPCEAEEENTAVMEEQQKEVEDGKRVWHERLDEDCRPFVVFGDMADMKPNKRREVLRTQKEPRIAPKKWKEYVFHEMSLNAECKNTDIIKKEYPKRQSPSPINDPNDQPATRNHSQQSFNSRRTTTASIELRGNMGSILKMITSSSAGTTAAQPKSTLLGARDSMEIVSTTKLRVKHQTDPVVIRLGIKPIGSDDFDDTENSETDPASSKANKDVKKYTEEDPKSMISINKSSLAKTPQAIPETMNFEKICPIEKCQRMEIDSFTRTLPAYMKASPFAHFEQTYENYNTCTPEQIRILKQRLEEKLKKEKADLAEEDPFREWEVDGVATQTSNLSLSIGVPSCTCNVPNTSPAQSIDRFIFNVKDLVPVKQNLDKINKHCFFDDNIQFNRFNVVGQGIAEDNWAEEPQQKRKNNRLEEVTKVLKQHPSLLDLFQANTL